MGDEGRENEREAWFAPGLPNAPFFRVTNVTRRDSGGHTSNRNKKQEEGKERKKKERKRRKSFAASPRYLASLH